MCCPYSYPAGGGQSTSKIFIELLAGVSSGFLVLRWAQPFWEAQGKWVAVFEIWVVFGC